MRLKELYTFIIVIFLLKAFNGNNRHFYTAYTFYITLFLFLRVLKVTSLYFLYNTFFIFTSTAGLVI